MSNALLPSSRPSLARLIRRLSVPIVLAWLAISAILTLGVPTLEQVAAQHSISLDPTDAPSFRAAERMGESFGNQTDFGASIVMIVLEAQEPLGDEAHEYYDGLIRQLQDDTKHVRYVQNFWGEELTRGAAESADGKAAYVRLALAGRPGEALTNEAVDAVQRIVSQSQVPPGIRAYVTGPAAISYDVGRSGNRSVTTVTLVSIAVILVVLLLVYRSVVTSILLLTVVGITLQAARGIVALLGHIGVIGLSTFVANLLVSICIAIGTDYGIFFIGRYQEARQSGEDRESAYYTTYRGVAKVVLASGLTIAGALLCLSFTRLPTFHVLGIPCAVGVVVAVIVALTLFPAVISVGSRFGLFDPRRNLNNNRWRRVGTAVVRWPGPVLVSTLAVVLVGLVTLPGFKPSFNDQNYLPKDIPAMQGIAAAERHFPQSAMKAPEVLLIETDHDLRNSADFLILNKLAKAVLAVPGISKVQAATRPEGTTIAHTTIPYMLSTQMAVMQQFQHFQKARNDDMLKQAELLGETIAIMRRMYGLMQQMTTTTLSMAQHTHEMQVVTDELRDNIANLDDFVRPIRNYFYWEPHCYDIPVCYSLKSIFDALDLVDALNDKLIELVGDLDQLTVLLPQLVAQFPEMIAIMETMRSTMLTLHTTMSGISAQTDDAMGNTTAMGKAFDAAKNDDSFYLPPDLFKDAGFKRLLDIFLSPDGKAARMFISQKGDPLAPEGVARVDAMKTAAEEALKGTPLEDSKVYLTGAAAITKDIVEGSQYDLMIVVIAALCLIFIVMLIMMRSLVAALVIVGTVVISLGTSFGLSVLVWQYLLGTQIHWVVLVMSVIVLLSVGSDYNLLLVARMKEELDAGINTGIIRAMGGTGKVVTNAGLVFALTMGSLIVSDLLSIGQVGTTIGLGLLFDTLIVRAFMVPSIAALLGRWFWWPQRVRLRPASTLLRPTGPRPLVRALLLNQPQ